MARSTAQAERIKPAAARPLRVQVRARRTVTPHTARVTLGGGDLADYVPMGFDQWFRLYLPTGAGSLEHVPARLTTASYAAFMLVPASRRPVLRNYTTRAHRAVGEYGPGPEIDVDFVLHGTAADGTAGPAATWAATCGIGDEALVHDEGRMFAPPTPTDRLLLACDETGLPGLAGILASLPADAAGVAVVEVPTEADRQHLPAPDGIEIRWVVRDDDTAVPGVGALAAAREVEVPAAPVYGWVAGESALATGLRRHWVHNGVPRSRITFCGYWKHGGH